MGHKNASILLFPVPSPDMFICAVLLGHWGKTPYLFKIEVVENAFEMTMDKKNPSVSLCLFLSDGYAQ